MTHHALRLLIVEDSAPQAENLEMILEDQGYTVHKAFTLQSGKVLAEVHPPDAIIVDICMPDGNGTEMVEWLREREKFAETPVVLVSALDPQDKPPLPLDSHVEYLQKPFTVEQLVEVLDSFTNKKGT